MAVLLWVCPPPRGPLHGRAARAASCVVCRLPIANVSSFLVYTVGQKIYIWQFKDKDMPGLIFIDSAVYVH